MANQLFCLSFFIFFFKFSICSKLPVNLWFFGLSHDIAAPHWHKVHTYLLHLFVLITQQDTLHYVSEINLNYLKDLSCAESSSARQMTETRFACLDPWLSGCISGIKSAHWSSNYGLREAFWVVMDNHWLCEAKVAALAYKNQVWSEILPPIEETQCRPAAQAPSSCSWPCPGCGAAQWAQLLPNDAPIGHITV